MTLQELVDVKREDNAKYKILFGDLVADIYSCKDDVKYSSFLEKEPNWDGLEKKDISLIVSAFVHLSDLTQGKIKAYKWLYSQKFILDEPYFALNAKGGLRDILLQESPPAYRRNNIFVSANVLTKV